MSLSMEPALSEAAEFATHKAATAEYIAMEMSRLARMASANKFLLLPYLIDMAVLEAWREASEPENREGASLDAKEIGASFI